MASQDDFKKSFHSITNLLYKITIRTGSLTKNVKMKSDRGMSDVELKEEFAKLLGALSDIEEITLQAGNEIQKLKDAVYVELKFNLNKDE